jgi:hypothetical protein
MWTEVKEKEKKKKPTKFEKLHKQVDESVKEEWLKIQLSLKEKLVLEDQFEWTLEGEEVKSEKRALRYVGAVDISYSKHNS